MLNKTELVFSMLIVAAIVALLAWSLFIMPESSCKKKAEKMGVPYDFAPGQGCMIEPTPGKWVPIQNYRVQ